MRDDDPDFEKISHFGETVLAIRWVRWRPIIIRF